VFHCRMGIGRSSLMAALLLKSMGLEGENVFKRISEIRGVRVPDTAEQEDWFKKI
jgi:protein-tyrosine phosphatase